MATPDRPVTSAPTRQQKRGVSDGSAEEAWAVVAEVVDPEIPVITIADLGILRGVEVSADRVIVVITPTYSGCPAMETIAVDCRRALTDAGYDNVEVRTVLSPAWTTDWITETGRQALQEFGIAPPSPRPTAGEPISLTLGIRCPQCGSLNTSEMSHFGSTACKSLWRCRDCAEPFDHFKAL